MKNKRTAAVEAKPVDESICNAVDQRNQARCTQPAGHVGAHVKGGYMWKDKPVKAPKAKPAPAAAEPKKPEPTRTERAAEMLTKAGYCASEFRFSSMKPDLVDVCTLSKGHDGRHENTSTGIVEHVPEEHPSAQTADLVAISEVEEPWQTTAERDIAEAQAESTALATVEPAQRMLLSVELARDLLSKSTNVDEVREVADKAKAVALYLRSVEASIESQNDAAEIRLRAERRLGEISQEIEEDARGRKPKTKAAQPAAISKGAKLAELGLKERDARRFEQLAKIPEVKFDELIEETRSKGERLTSSAPLKMVRQDAKAKLAAELRAKPIPQADGRFDVIVIDPPWKHDVRAQDITQRGQGDYPRMEIDEIKLVPVADRAEENCILFCWVTNQHMRQVYECLDAWGFREVSIITWAKSRFGVGKKLRGQTEHCIMAVKGSPIVTLTNESTWIEGELREHSRKPESFYELVESLCPGTKLEMFSRTPYSEQWAVWGNETNKFKGAA